MINWIKCDSFWIYRQNECKAKLDFLGTKWSLAINYYPRIYSDEVSSYDVIIFWNDRLTPNTDSAMGKAWEILEKEWATLPSSCRNW
jgi:hypothetical protein